MKTASYLAVFWLLFVQLVCGDRGTFSRAKDDQFQMLIAGGVIPKNAKYVRNLVSIRTLNYIKFHGDNHFCTGVILTSMTILTAAHCVTDIHKSVMHPRGLLIVFGSIFRLERYNDDDIRHVSKILIHNKYQRYENYDVAILKLTNRIPTNLRNVKPMVKRKRAIIPPGMKCLTFGWGQLYPHGPYSNEIMYLEVVVRAPDFCKEMDFFKAEGNICVEPKDEGEICPGDLGGPLICNDWLAGIIGGSMGCQGKKFMKFTNFTHVAEWVESSVIALSGNRCMLSLFLCILCQMHLF